MVYANIELLNQEDLGLHRRHFIGEDEIRQINVNMLVDSGSVMLAINEEIQKALGVPTFTSSRWTTIDIARCGSYTRTV